MLQQIFVNLPVKDLAASKAFFTDLGFTFNPQFTNDKAGCMIVKEDQIYVMLLTEPFFTSFTNKGIADTEKVNEALFAFSVESKKAVDALVQKALDVGASHYKEPETVGDFMYSWGFKDLDGHVWEILYMDPNYVQKN